MILNSIKFELICAASLARKTEISFPSILLNETWEIMKISIFRRTNYLTEYFFV